MRSVHPTARLVLLGSLSALAVGCGGEREEDPTGSRAIPGVILIENGEDTDNRILKEEELTWDGYWYTYDDKGECVNMVKSGMTTPLPVPQGGMAFAMTPYTEPGAVAAPIEGEQEANLFGARFFGGGHASTADNGFGAGLGFGLNGGTAPFDLNAAGVVGIRFLARNASGMQTMDVKLKDAWSDPAGGKCILRDEATCMPSQGCHDDPIFPVTLTDQWQEFSLRFDQFNRTGWGSHTDPPISDMFDPSQAYQVQFQVPPVEAFDVWIDNVGFIMADGAAPATPSGAPTTSPTQ